MNSVTHSISVLPNFMLVGAMRSGSTFLYHTLKQHPAIFLPPNKELRYFHDYGGSNNPPVDLQQYGQFFTGWQGEPRVGEMSPRYMYLEWVPEVLHTHLPEVRLLFTLRNPIDRAYSHYWHAVKSYSSHEYLSFERALQQEPERLKHGTLHERLIFSYVDSGFYWRQIQNFLRFFPPEQLHIVIFEEMVAQPQASLDAICDFLEIDHFFPESPPYQNRVSIPQMIRLQRVLTWAHLYYPQHLKGSAYVRRGFRQIQKLIPRATKYPPLNEKTRQHLRTVFADTNAELFAFLDKDPAIWS